MNSITGSRITCSSILLCVLLGCDCFRQKPATTSSRSKCTTVSGCPLSGLKSLDALEVVHPPPAVDASPFSDQTDDRYHFKDLGDFNNCDMHYLMPPLQKSLTLEMGHGCEVLVDDGQNVQWRAAEVAAKWENGSITVKWRDEHTGEFLVPANKRRPRPAWSFWAASPMTVYLDFYASAHAKSRSDILSRFKPSGWKISSLVGTRIKKGRGIMRRWSTAGPGLVLERTFPSGKMVTIPLPDDLKHNVLIWAKAECDMAKKCDPSIGGWMLTGNIIGKGSQGTIFEVQRYPVDNVAFPQLYALKRPNDERSFGRMIAEERQVMLDCAKCENVLDVADAMPCIYSLQYNSTLRQDVYHVNLEQYGYVTPRLANDMDKWFVANPPRSSGTRDKCMRTIHSQMSAGLQCMHEVGWVHGDYKTDNVLYSSISRDGCPEQIRLIDFGLSAQKDRPQKFYANSAYYSANHLVSGTFAQFPTPLHATPENRVDTLGIVLPPTHEFPRGAWNAINNVDWCGYLMVMRLWYGKGFRVGGLNMDCGIMGYKRGTWVKAKGNVNVPYPVPRTQPGTRLVYQDGGSAMLPPEIHPDVNFVADQAKAVYSPNAAVWRRPRQAKVM